MNGQEEKTDMFAAQEGQIRQISYKNAADKTKQISRHAEYA